MFPDGAEIFPEKIHSDVQLIDDDFLNTFMAPTKPANGVNTKHYNIVIKQVAKLFNVNVDIASITMEPSDPYWETQYSKLLRCKNNDPELSDQENFLNCIILLIERKISRLHDMHRLAIPISNSDIEKASKGIQSDYITCLRIATKDFPSASVGATLSDGITTTINFTISKEGDKVNITIIAGITTRTVTYTVAEIQKASLIVHLWNSMVDVFEKSEKQNQPGYDQRNDNLIHKVMCGSVLQ